MKNFPENKGQVNLTFGFSLIKSTRGNMLANEGEVVMTTSNLLQPERNNVIGLFQ
jgi:hypothetical protein